MKHKTADLSGADLDAAVAKSLGNAYALARTLSDHPGPHQCRLLETGEAYSPSANWSEGGPIIERERIAVMLDDSKGSNWYANVGAWMSHDLVCTPEHAVGPTPLVAAMRAFVRAKLGDEAEL